MKIKKLSSKKEEPLWRFFKKNLPSSLCAKEIGDGYGSVMWIEIKRSDNWLNRFNPFSDGIASVNSGTVTLRHPEYYSDFEQIIQAYEKESGNEVEFHYYED